MKTNKLSLITTACLLVLTGCNGSGASGGGSKTPSHVHTYDMDNIVWTWPEEIEAGKKATASVTCTSCDEGAEGHTETFDAPILVEKKEESTCTEQGYIEYKALFEYNDETYSDTKRVDLDYAAHDFSDSWTYDETSHWHVCQNEGCTATDEKIAHTFDQEIVSEDNLASAATCSSPAKYYKSCVCGAVSTTETFESGELGSHDVRHYTRLEPTADTYGCKEYWECLGCGEIAAFDNEFAIKYAYGTSTLLQFKITTGIAAKCDFLTTGTEGFEISQNTPHTVGYFSNSAEAKCFAAVFNEAFSENEEYTIKKGSQITDTEGGTYTLNKDYTFTYIGADYGWRMDTDIDLPGLVDSWTEAGTASPVSDSSDPRFLPTLPKEVTLTNHWSNEQNVQMDISSPVSGAADGDRLKFANAADCLESNIILGKLSLRVWSESIIGLDTDNLTSIPNDGSYVYFKKGLLLKDKNECYYKLASDFLVAYYSGAWTVVDTSSVGMVDYITTALSGTIAYFYPHGTNLRIYKEGDAQTGGIVGSQCSYSGSIKFCGVEFSALNSFSDSLHLFATINGANWNAETLAIKIYDNDTWISQGYSHISDFSKYDFGTENPTISIASGTTVTLTEGNGGTYFFKNETTLTYSGGSWNI